MKVAAREGVGSAAPRVTGRNHRDRSGGLFYALVVVGILTIVSSKLLHETDERVADQLVDARQLSPAQLSSRADLRRDSDDPPVYFWQINAASVITATSPDAFVFPGKLKHEPSNGPRTVFVDGRDFRFDAVARADGSRIYAAESLAQPHHVRSLLMMSALVVSPALLAAVFVSAFVIGRSASKPVESARVRQLEFTADASHELRTPLTVIEAEVGLALTTDRTASGYREALQRVSGETPRLPRSSRTCFGSHVSTPSHRRLRPRSSTSRPWPNNVLIGSARS